MVTFYLALNRPENLFPRSRRWKTSRIRVADASQSSIGAFSTLRHFVVFGRMLYRRFLCVYLIKDGIHAMETQREVCAWSGSWARVMRKRDYRLGEMPMPVHPSSSAQPLFGSKRSRDGPAPSIVFCGLTNCSSAVKEGENERDRNTDGRNQWNSRKKGQRLGSIVR